MRFITRRLAAVLAVAATLFMVTSANAWAATGSYPFAANFKTSLRLPDFAAKPGTMKYSFHCTADRGQSYAIQLWKNNIGSDTHIDDATGYCDSTDDVWNKSITVSGQYYIKLLHGDNGKRIVGSGTVSYQK